MSAPSYRESFYLSAAVALALLVAWPLWKLHELVDWADERIAVACASLFESGGVEVSDAWRARQGGHRG